MPELKSYGPVVNDLDKLPEINKKKKALLLQGTLNIDEIDHAFGNYSPQKVEAEEIVSCRDLKSADTNRPMTVDPNIISQDPRIESPDFD